MIRQNVLRGDTASASRSKTQNVASFLLGAMLIFAGIGHLTFLRIDFRAQVPDWLPMDVDLVVVLSGFVEIALGCALLFIKKQRPLVGWVVGLFFIAVFPGNLSQFLGHKDAFSLNSDTLRLVRLFFQPVFIAWAWWSTGAWGYFRNFNNGD